jgi:hypothetical protein
MCLEADGKKALQHALRELRGRRPAQSAAILQRFIVHSPFECDHSQPLPKRSRLGGDVGGPANYGAFSAADVAEVLGRLAVLPHSTLARQTTEFFLRTVWAPAVELLSVAWLVGAGASLSAVSARQAQWLASYIEEVKWGSREPGGISLRRSANETFHVSQGEHVLVGLTVINFVAAAVTVLNGEDAAACRAAIPFLHRCLRESPNFGASLFLLGLCYHRTGEHSRAAKLFRAAGSQALTSARVRADCLMMVRASNHRSTRQILIL